MGRASSVSNLRYGAPPNWPSTIIYLAHPIPSPKLSPSHRQTFCTPSPSPIPKLPSLRLKKIDDKNHPAWGQFGLFNGGKSLKPGSWIRDYIGVVHTTDESDEKSDYDLSLVRGEVGCDASKQGNEARFVNDYRGIADKPNAMFDLRTYDLGNGKGNGMRMAIFAGPEGIKKHAEICVSYGKGFWKNRTEEVVAEDGIRSDVVQEKLS